MEESSEIQNFFIIWTIVIASLCYCHSIDRLIPSGTSKRLLAISPVVFLFFLLHFAQTTISLGGLTSFFIAWLCNFKLLLLAFGTGPLVTSPPLPLHLFLAIACLPIKRQTSEGGTQKGHKSAIIYLLKWFIIIGFWPLYQMKEKVPPMLLSLIYIVFFYVALEMCLAVVGVAVRRLIGIEIEPQFHEPYLSTSLQDFWGRRWNLMVTNILHPTIYVPVRSLSSRVIGSQWASLPAAFASFFVSAVMHELIFYYIGRKTPNWAVSCFFLLHGVCMAVEIAVKKAFARDLPLPPMVSRLLTVGFVLGTGLWIFLPALLRIDAEEKGRNEVMAVARVIKDIARKMGFSKS